MNNLKLNMSCFTKSAKVIIFPYYFLPDPMLMAALVVGSTTCDSPPTSPTATSCGCTLRRIAPTNTTMSAVYRSGSFALDGNFATYASTKSVKGETFPWIALELSPDSLLLVRKVAVVLIAHANAKLFASVEVRVAASPHPRHQEV